MLTAYRFLVGARDNWEVYAGAASTVGMAVEITRSAGGAASCAPASLVDDGAEGGGEGGPAR
jgi:hypothetical protein